MPGAYMGNLITSGNLINIDHGTAKNFAQLTHMHRVIWIMLSLHSHEFTPRQSPRRSCFHREEKHADDGLHGTGSTTGW